MIEAVQYAAPFESKFVPLEEFNEKLSRRRHLLEVRPQGRPHRSQGVLRPRTAALFPRPFGRRQGPSDGWSFTNSFCSERYVGGIEKGRPPYEAGCSAKDTDYLHVINWKKAAELVKAGKAKKINGFDVLPMDVSVKEGILFLVPEPKSPHGADVTPDGKYIVVSGKLDTHVSVFSFEKIQAAIKAGKFESKDPYGIPVIGMKDALHTQVQLGLGPLHTQYDSKPCVAYTSLYVDSQVAKWNFCEGKVLDKLSIHYNIGHLMTMEGDSVNPKGKYLVALNKLSIDRFNPVGPLHPQNHQLIDIGNDKMQLLYDMPLPAGRAALCRRDRGIQTQAGRALQGRHQQPHRQAASRHGQGGRGEDHQEGQQGRGLRHPDPLPHHARDDRGRGRGRGHDQPDQPRARPGRDPRFYGRDSTTCMPRSSRARRFR